MKDEGDEDSLFEEFYENEFIDDDHDVDEEYYEIMDTPTLSLEVKEKKLLKIIKNDPNYFDPYLSLYNLYIEAGKNEEAENIIGKAYNNCIKYLKKEDGNLPEQIYWDYVENRHILRVFITTGIHQWKKNEYTNALDLFRLVFDWDQDDGAGVRLYILAIKMKLSFEAFEKRFVNNGVYSNKVFDWFDKNFNKFPDEFSQWEEYDDD